MFYKLMLRWWEAVEVEHNCHLKTMLEKFIKWHLYVSRILQSIVIWNMTRFINCITIASIRLTTNSISNMFLRDDWRDTLTICLRDNIFFLRWPISRQSRDVAFFYRSGLYRCWINVETRWSDAMNSVVLICPTNSTTVQHEGYW